MWDPASYLRYGDERSRPFFDLVARIGADRPRVVVDLGCGPGNLTRSLSARWPGARIVGLDSSIEMIEAATASAGSGVSTGSGRMPAGAGVEFAVADARSWSPGPEVDVVLSNAMLQWVPEHEALLLRWARELSAGSWLAVQVPGNSDAASHRELRALVAQPRWRDRVGQLSRDLTVSDATGYATLLTGANCAVDAWETSYVHLLPASETADHPVLTWMEGTALRPVRAALGGAGTAWDEFRSALGERLVAAYPVRHGLVQFPFRRIFVVARTGARH
ncbi:trans-aconitate 2-methyltransferase [Plantactinospora sp. WMMC1484]|uniref:trans-aconitate 2-methyltransferase n=1 Tax=Plantactinospora sp. WMMC1484 TaxID=3404122 RepID=UPI003BF56237